MERVMVGKQHESRQEPLSLLDRLIFWLSPTLAREKKKMEMTVIENDTAINSYSEMSKKIQNEVDANHFSKFLIYEKK